MIRLGDLANEQGDGSKAIFLWKTARALFKQSLQSNEVTRIDARLSVAKPELATVNAPDQLLNRESSDIEREESVVPVPIPC
jgi:hypothetical protein